MKSLLSVIIGLWLSVAAYSAWDESRSLAAHGAERDFAVQSPRPAPERGLDTLPLTSAAPTDCHYYASPRGGGDGRSPSRPFKVAQFWSLASPGKTLCLMDGIYTGNDSMIDPPDHLSGVPEKPIVVRALNDGKVTIDGQGARAPVLLNRNSHFVLEGFNAHSSSLGVVRVVRSSHNVVRRIAAWDAADGNDAIVSAGSSEHVLFEDVAAWGIGRKVFEASQGGNHVTCRRCWGRWEGSHFIGPKLTYTLAYNNYDMLIENSIGTWSGERMQESYLIRCDAGRVNPRCGRQMSDYSVDQPEAIFGVDAITRGSKAARSKILGSIGYVTAKDRFAGHSVFWVINLDAVEFRDNAAFIDQAQEGKRPFALYGLSGGNAEDLVATNLTGIGPRASLFDRSWRKDRVSEGPNPAKTENVFFGTRGAQICKRYKDGKLTAEPLWPWPMNGRIIDAMVQSGRVPVDVTKTIEAIFGPIPGQCRT